MKKILVKGSLKNFFYLSALTAICMSSCAPKTVPIVRGTRVPFAGPKYLDPDLKVDGSQSVAALSWSADVTAASVYRLNENLFKLRGVLNGASRREWAERFIEDLPQAKSKLVDSPYIDLVIRQSEKTALLEINDMLLEIKKTPTFVRKIVREMALPAEVAGEGNVDPIELAIKQLFQYLRDFDQRLISSEVHQQVKEKIHFELSKMIALQERALSDLSALKVSNTLQTSLDAVLKMAANLKVEIPQKTEKDIIRARDLAKSVDGIVDASSALSAIVSVWIFFTPEERIANIKSANEKLYNYLEGMSLKELQCLQSKTCSSFSKRMAKKMFILPKIEEFGVEKIRKLMNEKGVSEVAKQTLKAINDQSRGMGELILSQVEAKLRVELEPVQKLQSDFRGQIRKRIDQWAKKTIESKGPSISVILPARAKLQIDDSGKVMVGWSQMPANTIENMGALDGLLPILWNELILASDQKLDLAANQVRGLVLSKMSSLAQMYIGGSNVLPSEVQSVSARAFSEVIRGLAGLANSFKEWQNSPIDMTFNSARVKDLFPEYSSAAVLTRPLFPKAAFYGLSFHGLSANLQSVHSERTQVFLIDANNRILRANVSPSEESAPMIMAGIADRNGTELSPTVRSEDISRFLLAICDIYEATQGIEKATSEFLVQTDEKGNIPKDLILKSREKMRLLILVLANFLSHQFRSGGELIHQELQIATQKPIGSMVSVMDQAIAIRALVAASQVLGNEIYIWEAVDLLASMNRLLYRPSLGFYGNPNEVSTSVSPFVLLESLRALDTISPYLNDFSRNQVEHIAMPWRAKISSWQLQKLDENKRSLR